MSDSHSYYLFYKPYNVLTQFTKEHPEHITLAEFLKVEKDVYPVGRLDKDSEGLLVLTNDSYLNAALLKPSNGHKKTYAAQVEGEISEMAIRTLTQGVNIKLDTGYYRTNPCEVKRLFKEPQLPERNPPIRFRASIPTSWILITLTEGKNRQVRKMLAAVGFPVLRLVRLQIEDAKIGKLQPGESRKLSKEEMYKQLHIIEESGTKKQSVSPKRNKIDNTDIQAFDKKPSDREGMSGKPGKSNAVRSDNKGGFSAWRQKGKTKRK